MKDPIADKRAKQMLDLINNAYREKYYNRSGPPIGIERLAVLVSEAVHWQITIKAGEKGLFITRDQIIIRENTDYLTQRFYVGHCFGHIFHTLRSDMSNRMEDLAGAEKSQEEDICDRIAFQLLYPKYARTAEKNPVVLAKKFHLPVDSFFKYLGTALI